MSRRHVLNYAEQREKVNCIAIIVNSKFMLCNCSVRMSQRCLHLCLHHSTNELCHSFSTGECIVFILVHKHKIKVQSLAEDQELDLRTEYHHRQLCVIKKATVIYSLEHGLHALNVVSMSTLHVMEKEYQQYQPVG